MRLLTPGIPAFGVGYAIYLVLPPGPQPRSFTTYWILACISGIRLPIHWVMPVI
ncbi:MULTISPECIES: hypothetical protein [Methylobacterium]|uniref:hypothetical protein n=1 Tax=Methylobacterium TaxID=407 RepID=UPI001EE20848|nr:MULTISPECIES: hypothetical protein [Methylobacterium]